jgi:hypothetical protein
MLTLSSSCILSFSPPYSYWSSPDTLPSLRSSSTIIITIIILGPDSTYMSTCLFLGLVYLTQHDCHQFYLLSRKHILTRSCNLWSHLPHQLSQPFRAPGTWWQWDTAATLHLLDVSSFFSVAVTHNFSIAAPQVFQTMFSLPVLCAFCPGPFPYRHSYREIQWKRIV